MQSHEHSDHDSLFKILAPDNLYPYPQLDSLYQLRKSLEPRRDSIGGYLFYMKKRHLAEFGENEEKKRTRKEKKAILQLEPELSNLISEYCCIQAKLRYIYQERYEIMKYNKTWFHVYKEMYKYLVSQLEYEQNTTTIKDQWWQERKKYHIPKVKEDNPLLSRALYLKISTYCDSVQHLLDERYKILNSMDSLAKVIALTPDKVTLSSPRLPKDPNYSKDEQLYLFMLQNDENWNIMVSIYDSIMAVFE